MKHSGHQSGFKEFRSRGDEDDSDQGQSVAMKVGKVVLSGLGKVGSSLKTLSRTARFSFISMREGLKEEQRKKPPSQGTLEMIKHIHSGFEPICLSAKRWAAEEKMEKKQNEDQLESLIEVYERYRKDNHEQLQTKKKVTKMYKLEEPNFVYQMATTTLKDCQRRVAELREKKVEGEQQGTNIDEYIRSYLDSDSNELTSQDKSTILQEKSQISQSKKLIVNEKPKEPIEKQVEKKQIPQSNTDQEILPISSQQQIASSQLQENKPKQAKEKKDENIQLQEHAAKVISPVDQQGYNKNNNPFLKSPTKIVNLMDIINQSKVEGNSSFSNLFASSQAPKPAHEQNQPTPQIFGQKQPNHNSPFNIQQQPVKKGLLAANRNQIGLFQSTHSNTISESNQNYGIPGAQLPPPPPPQLFGKDQRMNFTQGLSNQDQYSMQNVTKMFSRSKMQPDASDSLFEKPKTERTERRPHQNQQQQQHHHRNNRKKPQHRVS